MPAKRREKVGSAHHGLTVVGRMAVERAERAGLPRDIGDAPIAARAQQFEHHLLGLARIHERYCADRLERQIELGALPRHWVCVCCFTARRRY